MLLADEIRDFVRTRIVEPARANGRLTVEVCARDVIRALRMRDRTPAICSALDAAKFATSIRAAHITRSGPRAGSNARWDITLAAPSTKSRLGALIAAAPSDEQPPPTPAAPAARVSAGEFLDRERRSVIDMVRRLNSSNGERLDLGEQVRRLAEAKHIPFVTYKLIQCLLAVRNSVVYDGRCLSDVEFEQVVAIASATRTGRRRRR